MKKEKASFIILKIFILFAGDALFNFPAFSTANLWTKSGTPTYFYSFEHKGNASKGYNFLAGIPLVSEEGNS